MARMILLHGFTQTARSWGHVADAFRSRGHEPIPLDLPGHADPSTPVVIDDLATSAVSIAARGGSGTWVGYSMGARLALHVALARPDVVERLVLLGGTAGIDDAVERDVRLTHDDRLAQRLEADGVERFLAEWFDQPLFADRPFDPAERADRVRNTAAGLASSLRHWGTGTMNLWSRLDEIEAPTLVLAGEDDQKFTVLGRRLSAAVGDHASFRTIPNAGHAAHLERPLDFARIVDEWLHSLVRAPIND